MARVVGTFCTELDGALLPTITRLMRPRERAATLESDACGAIKLSCVVRGQVRSCS